ncbi:MAG: hypothetical protein JXJ22_01785 [Bacteroidales bacterium]|nr:hypothetical protein [Bacteroidales bacterium]
MKTRFFLPLIYILICTSCEYFQDDNNLKTCTEFLNDTIVLDYNNPVTFTDCNVTLTFDSLVEDSRCPLDVSCIWGGNAGIQVHMRLGENSGILTLNTNPGFATTDYFMGYSITLVKLEPYPYSNITYVPDDYKASVIIKKCNYKKYTGIVKDYTGLDGCGYLIETWNGEILNPVQVVPEFTFYNGQHVSFYFTELQDYYSTCMTGINIRIDSISETGCKTILGADYASEYLQKDNDLFEIEQLMNLHGCLSVDVEYGGGCKKHEFTMVQIPDLSAAPIIDTAEFLLYHNSNNDLCEAYIHNRLLFSSGLFNNSGYKVIKIYADYPQVFKSLNLE